MSECRFCLMDGWHKDWCAEERKQQVQDAEHRVAQAALKAWEPATFAMISLAYKSKGPQEWREFTDSLDDLRKLKADLATNQQPNRKADD